MNRTDKNFKYAFGMAVFTSICFNVLMTPLTTNMTQSVIVFCGTVFFIILPFLLPSTNVKEEW